MALVPSYAWPMRVALIFEVGERWQVGQVTAEVRSRVHGCGNDCRGKSGASKAQESHQENIMSISFMHVFGVKVHVIGMQHHMHKKSRPSHHLAESDSETQMLCFGMFPSKKMTQNMGAYY
eukprot:6156142-Amphidinium_carterae.1